jgi:hypothetical protein
MIYKYWINGQKHGLYTLTLKKTKALIISNNTNIPELSIRFNDESVELVDNHKHLGVTFVSDGNWTVHIENIARSALTQVNVLRKLKFILSKQALSNIYLTFTSSTDSSLKRMLNSGILVLFDIIRALVFFRVKVYKPCFCPLIQYL